MYTYVEVFSYLLGFPHSSPFPMHMLYCFLHRTPDSIHASNAVRQYQPTLNIICQFVSLWSQSVDQ